MRALPTVLLLGGAVFGGCAALPPPPDVTPLNTSAGWELVFRPDTLKTSFQALMPQLETQGNQMLCSVATAVTILNGMAEIAAPVDPIYEPYAYWTQAAYTSNSCVKRICPGRTNTSFGCTLPQAADTLRCIPGVTVMTLYANDTDLDGFREFLLDKLSQPGTHVAANFFRTGIHEFGGGHFSPIAAYSTTDQVLLLDVARYKYPSLWVPVEQLYSAMRALDPGSGRTRGVYVVSYSAAGGSASK